MTILPTISFDHLKPHSKIVISFYKSLQQLVVSCEMLKILIFTHTPYIGITFVYVQELVLRARQLDSVTQLVRARELDSVTQLVKARQLDSVTQFVRVLHRNRKDAGSIPATGPIVAYFFSWL